MQDHHNHHRLKPLHSDAEDSMELDMSAFATRLRCGRGGGGDDDEDEESSKLLVCSEIGCPIAIHEKCVTSEPKIDGAGKFYCPYCTHKRALVTAERLKRKAMKAKEVLSRFISMSSGVVPSDESREEENRSEDNAGGGIDGGNEERNVMDEVAPETGEFQGGSPLLRKKRYKRKAQRLQAIQRESSSPSRKSSSEFEAEDVVVVVENGAEESEKERNDGESDDESSKVRRSQRFNPHERVAPSEFDLNRDVESDHIEKDTDYVSFELRDILEPSQNEKAKNNVSSESREIPEPSQNEKATEVLPKSTTQVPDLNQNVKTSSSAQPMKVQEFGSEDFLFNSNKRRKVNWTAEEIKALKEGVEYFSMQVNKNLPWRKILKHGSHIFHKTRTPDNLKDKWKVLCREASNR